MGSVTESHYYLASPLFSTHADCESNSDTSRDAHVRAGQQSNDSEAKLVEAVGIEQPAVHLMPTILERFRGQVSMRTRPKNTNKTRYRTFL